MTRERYFQIVSNILDRHWAIVHHDTNCELLGTEEGHILSTATFLDDSYLDFEEFIHIDQDEVRFGYYKYQYVKEKKPFFRYDNFPLHPGISQPYHHKHPPESNQVMSLDRKPKLIEIIEEIAHLF